MSAYRYYAPKCTLFGYGCLAALGEEMNRRGYRHALIVTDGALVKLGIAGKLAHALEEHSIDYEIFDGVKPNPAISTVEAGLAMLKKHACDVVISLGGGSAHDCAKAITIVATNGGNILDYRGTDKSTVAPLPLVAVNTTAGTASECTRAYVIVNEETQEKYGAKDSNCMAAIAVDDHELMMGLPAGLTAGTGMDALTHAVEAYLSLNGFLLTSELAVSSVKLVFKHLKQAVTRSDEASREAMAVAQYLAGLAFGNAGCGLVHSMSHQLSAVYDLPHGLCNAILLPEVCRFHVREERVQERYAKLSEEVFPLECSGLTTGEKAELLIARIEALSEVIGTRKQLRELGVREEDLELLAEKALLDGSLPNNPIQPSKEQIEEIYRKCL